MRSVQVSNPNGPFEIVERKTPEPGPMQVRIKVQACGICHSDSFTKEGLFPGIQYPRVPGHEVAGVIDVVGKDVATTTEWKAGQRVAVGWHGGHDGHCESCRRGDFVTCRYAQIPGISYDGGYADYMIAPTEALAIIPDELSATDAAPLTCAGITTYIECISYNVYTMINLVIIMIDFYLAKRVKSFRVFLDDNTLKRISAVLITISVLSLTAAVFLSIEKQ